MTYNVFGGTLNLSQLQPLSAMPTNTQCCGNDGSQTLQSSGAFGCYLFVHKWLLVLPVQLPTH